MHAVMLVQLMDYEDDVCGFIHKWVNVLAHRVSVLDVLTLRKREVDVPENVRLHVLKPGGDESRWVATFRFYQALLNIVRHSPVDVIFCHMTPVYTVVAAPIAKLWRIPLVTWYTHEAVTLSLRLADKLSDKMLTASEESFCLESKKLIVTNHGIDTDEFSPRKHESKGQASLITICSIGRISPRKDYEILINAANILVHEKKVFNVRFVIIGKEGTSEQKQYVESIMKMVEDYGLVPYFEFLGSIPHRNIAEYHRKSDIFVNMRQTGGMDKAVLEAMACEIPTVVCNKTFIPLFGTWAEQLIFKEKNARNLARRLYNLVRLTPETRREIGKNLRNVVVQEHDLEKLMDRIVGIFRSL